MEKRKLGNSELHISPIVLGAWPFGGGGWKGGWGFQDDRDSLATIDRALELGINMIDVAPYYGLGHAEEIVGRALRGRRDQAIIATKCGLVWDPGSTEIREHLKADSIFREVEASLRRLQMETIDLYQVHWPKPDEDIEEAWEAIGKLIVHGKVRYGGVSNFTVSQLDRVRSIREVCSLQPRYGMLEREAEKDVIPYCGKRRIGVITYWALQGGLLTGHFSWQRAASLPADDWRHNRHYFLEPELSANLAFVESVKPIASRLGVTVAQLAVAWVLRLPVVTGTILGARRPSQIEETARAWNVKLGPEDSAEIDTLLRKRERAVR
jgi:aryl-alcohol dehydrogenase-like predicted oxidoreductase